MSIDIIAGAGAFRYRDPTRRRGGRAVAGKCGWNQGWASSGAVEPGPGPGSSGVGPSRGRAGGRREIARQSGRGRNPGQAPVAAEQPAVRMPGCRLAPDRRGLWYAAVGDGKMRLATGLNSLALLDWRGYCGYQGGSGERGRRVKQAAGGRLGGGQRLSLGSRLLFGAWVLED